MTTLHVIPEGIYDQLVSEGVDLSFLYKSECLSTHLSAHDIAQIQLATESFPFKFDPVLQINIAKCEVTEDGDSENSEQNMHYRVGEHLTQIRFELQSDKLERDATYRLKPIDADRWVAVQQRLHVQAGDPQPVTSNRPFFEKLIAQALHVVPFETVCKTNLFSYYLDSITE